MMICAAAFVLAAADRACNPEPAPEPGTVARWSDGAAGR